MKAAQLFFVEGFAFRMRQLRFFLSEKVLLACVLLAMVLVRLVMVGTAFDPAYDQSMILANFPLDHPSDILRPLPFFEQTTTLGHGVVLDTLARVFGPEGMARIHAIRLIAAMVFCGALFWLYHLLRNWMTPAEALVSVAIMGSSPTALTFAVNSKHYVFEFVATVLLLAVALQYLRKPSFLNGLWVAACVVVVGLFAFVAPVIVTAVGLAVLVTQILHDRMRGAAGAEIARRMGGTVALGLVLIAIVAVFYFGYTRVVTVNDLAAFSERDAKKFMQPDAPFSAQTLSNALTYGTYFFKLVELNTSEFETPKRLYHLAMATPVVALFLLGLTVVRKRSVFWVTAAVVAPLFTLALNFAQVLPFSGVRQHLFAAPLVVPVIVIGFFTVLRWLAGPRTVNGLSAALVVVAIGLSGFGALRVSGPVTGLVAQMEESGAPVWAYYGAQPLLHSVKPSWAEDGAKSPVTGLLRHASSTQRWVLQAREEDESGMQPAYFAQASSEIAQHDKLWLVFSMWYFDIARIDGLEMFLNLVRGPERDCAVWRNQTSTMVAYCASTADVAAMRRVTPSDEGAAWNHTIVSGDWRRYVKGAVGKSLREEQGQPQRPLKTAPIAAPTNVNNASMLPLPGKSR